NPWQLFARKHIHHAIATYTRLHRDTAGMLGDNFANDGGFLAKRVFAHDRQHKFGILRPHKGDELAFVGDVERVEAEDFTSAFDGFVNRNVSFLEADAHARLPGDFIESAGDTAASGIAEDVNVRSRRQHGLHESVEWRGVAFDFAFKFKALAHRHDRNAVRGNRTIDDDFVTGLRAAGMNVYAGIDQPEAGGVDENFVALAAVHDLRITRHQADAGNLRCLSHGLNDAPEIGQRQALLKDERGRKIKRARAAHREVVDGAVDGQFADVATGKENWIDHKRVGAESEPGAIQRKHRAIVQGIEQIVFELRQDHFLNQLLGKFRATAVGQDDFLVRGNGERT